MALARHETVLDLDNESRVGGDAYTFPKWLDNLDPDAIKSLREVAGEYASSQRAAALSQEVAVVDSGVKLEYFVHDDPYTTPEDREFIDTVVGCMMGVRLSYGDGLERRGNRTRGEDTPLTAAFKELSPALNYWREHLVPRAAALDVLYNPRLPVLPVVRERGGDAFTPWQKNDMVASAMFAESLDGRAIRSRGEIVKQTLVENFMDTERFPDGSEVRVASLACGSASVVLSAVANLIALRPSLKVTVSLIDTDQDALEAAGKLIDENSNLGGVTFHFLNSNLLFQGAFQEASERVGGEKYHFVEGTGILEYLKDSMAGVFLSRAAELLDDGGMLCMANMRTTQEQLDFTLNCASWPHIVPRDLSNFVSLLCRSTKRQQADLTLKLADDGVYAVACMSKAQID